MNALKANRPRMDRQKWLAIRGNGGNIGKFYASIARFLHVAQSYVPITRTDEKTGTVYIIEHAPVFKDLTGKKGKGRTYVKQKEEEDV